MTRLARVVLERLALLLWVTAGILSWIGLADPRVHLAPATALVASLALARFLTRQRRRPGRHVPRSEKQIVLRDFARSSHRLIDTFEDDVLADTGQIPAVVIPLRQRGVHRY